MKKRPNKWHWVAVIIVVSMLSVYTAWYLQLNPQQIPLFLITTIIAIGFAERSLKWA